MSQSSAQVSAPKTKYLADYQKPDFTIKTVDLNFDLHDDITHVTSKMSIKRQGAALAPLVLDGKDMTLQSVMVDGKSVVYKADKETLTIENVPDEFELVIANDIDPASNTALEGLYMSNGMFCTQCEAQGFRRITYFLDRPDVMSVFTTTVIADKKMYPVLLSNGNKLQCHDSFDDRHGVTWLDPHPKPSYLFALVAGDSLSKFEAIDAGDHYYAVRAINRFGESALTVLSGTAVTTVLGSVVDLQFTAGTGGRTHQ